ncbi:hypothetical protein GCM10023186_36890 [Hymenobacter koreensis]|uniref:ATP-binding protein n=2 Tax=Hymenobacter koreensis TaxID=1084523 RepID=A0ABP8JED7_9BACT
MQEKFRRTIAPGIFLLNLLMPAALTRGQYYDLKQHADKIIQHLRTVRNEAGKSRRRWIWELMQNAKDIPNTHPGGVSIEIRLSPRELRFSHDGEPFSLDNLYGLVLQVSTKDSAGRNPEETGKFGTGFISTHLLAEEVQVEGVAVDNRDRKWLVRLPLDRSAASSEALMPKIAAARQLVEALESEEGPTGEAFEELPATADSMAADHPTVFTYYLGGEEQQRAAQVGVADLVNTLPYTLINLPQIKQVRIINEAADTKYVYRCQALTSIDVTAEEKVVRYEVTIENARQGSQTVRSFATYLTNSLQLSLEVADFEGWQLLDIREARADLARDFALLPNERLPPPTLYRDFPLIGTDSYHLPFVLNGKTLYPTEPRDGILLTGDTLEPQHNRTLLLAARDASLRFTEWLLAREARNTYLLATTGLPGAAANLEPDARKWYSGLQQAWREKLVALPLVETEQGPRPLAQVRIPYFRSNAAHADNQEVWALAAPLLGPARVPRSDIAQRWIDVLGLADELPSWGPQSLVYSLENMLVEVAAAGDVSQLQLYEVAGAAAPNAYDWLNELYRFLAKRELLEPMLKAHAIVPSKYGKLYTLNSLHTEPADAPIPTEVLDLLRDLGDDWYAKLMHEQITLPGHAHPEKNLAAASEALNTLLTKEEFLQDSLRAEQILLRIVRLKAPESKEDAHYSQLYEFASALLPDAGQITPVATLAGFYFGNATRLLVRLVNRRLAATVSVTGLAAALDLSEAATMNWLDGYLYFLQEAGFEALLREMPIVPNRRGQLRKLTDLHHNGTADEPLDEELLAVLQLLDAADWNALLLADGLRLRLDSTYKRLDLGSAIMQRTNGIGVADYQAHHVPLMRLIDWCHIHHAEAAVLLPQFVAQANTIFFALAVGQGQHGRAVVELLKDEKRLSKLLTISAYLTDHQLQELLHLVEEEHEFTASFRFLQRIGALMEEAFRNALKLAGIAGEVIPGEATTRINFKGIGAYDFEIVNTDNGKRFLIELKSYRLLHNEPQPIHLAISQARQAAQQEPPFALCVIGRDRDADQVDAPYVQEHLVYLRNLATDFAEVATEIQQLTAIAQKAPGAIRLQTPKLNDNKVRVEQAFIQDPARRHTFSELIEDIKAHLS